MTRPATLNKRRCQFQPLTRKDNKKTFLPEGFFVKKEASLARAWFEGHRVNQLFYAVDRCSVLGKNFLRQRLDLFFQVFLNRLRVGDEDQRLVHVREHRFGLDHELARIPFKPFQMGQVEHNNVELLDKARTKPEGQQTDLLFAHGFADNDLEHASLRPVAVVH